ncbi:MAG: cytochrome ubiquinol oxidase subunit I [Selenomonadales bacterium]|nr:cytochrome ubiquinol oxidase subunit I [Selenomonadales bacterium]
MDEVLLSRWQFAITTVYHFLFVPITLGLAFFIAMLETWYVKTGEEKYRSLTQFWGKIFLVNFAMGVVTGIVQEFHFGMNWSEYARFMGDVFGAPLAMEALTAFFLESTFLGIWLFGWDKLSKKVHALCIWIVAFSSSLSAFWIIVANSFMQNPVGFAIQNGRAEMVDFVSLITNPYAASMYVHTWTSALATAGVLIVAVCAYQILAGRHTEMFKSCMKGGLVVAMVGLLSVMGTGHMQAQMIHDYQPMKSAATEAIWDTVDPAPFYLTATIDEENGANTDGIKVDGALSALLYNKFEGEVVGMNQLQAEYVEKYGEGNYIPEVSALFWSFRAMVIAGSVMMAVVGLAFLAMLFGRLERYSLLLRGLIMMLPLPFIANSCGWFVTEGGRQPWIVYGLQKVADAVSPNLTTTEIWISMVGFTLVYAALIVVALWIVMKHIKTFGMTEEAKKGASLWN